MHPIKGFNIFLRTLGRVKADLPEVMLAIAGADGDGHGRRLQRLAQSLNMQGQVYWSRPIEKYVKRGLLIDTDLFSFHRFQNNSAWPL